MSRTKTAAKTGVAIGNQRDFVAPRDPAFNDPAFLAAKEAGDAEGEAYLAQQAEIKAEAERMAAEQEKSQTNAEKWEQEEAERLAKGAAEA